MYIFAVSSHLGALVVQVISTLYFSVFSGARALVARLAVARRVHRRLPAG